MKQHIVVFGANGRVGRRVVAEALRRGYEVTAFVHRATDLPVHDNLRIVQGDIYNPADVEGAVEGATAVVSALGSWGTPAKDILTAGMSAIIPAMRRHKIRTIVSLTGADARAPGDTLGIIHRLTHAGLMLVAPKILIDGEQHIALLADSGLDWTVLRAPIMRARPVERYRLRTTRPLPWQTVAYDAVALAMINAVEDRTWTGHAPYIV